MDKLGQDVKFFYFCFLVSVRIVNRKPVPLKNIDVACEWSCKNYNSRMNHFSKNWVLLEEKRNRNNWNKKLRMRLLK